MQDTLYRLIYVSRNGITENDDILREEIAGILDCSRRNNAHAGVTGALMFNRGCFAQVLEGPRDAVQETFERIQCDERHSHVSVLAFETVETRGFSHWAMAYVGEDNANIDEFAGFAEESGFEPERLAGEQVYELLQAHLLEAEHG
ncbi:BLUF domain-containing protein [Pistricoccus aurantiacus]|uniref:BLUF domain-containing protein n=1 Tax=Pistricoccus aurantiacus TaxID=1883414 RepID=A0A5B8SS41_9GAMM|nr:BLUF domain-containing protein [Pistricoccus aurantiacus]QEA38275.1 BLUF domain-containing protein [Pistricoccus aurantiacus]